MFNLLLYHIMNQQGCVSFKWEPEFDTYPRHFILLTHISPFWRTYESNDTGHGIAFQHTLQLYLILESVMTFVGLSRRF